MNLAVEYLARSGNANQMLKIPFSLQVENVFDASKMVITVQNCYGQPHYLLIKHWRIKDVVHENILPPVDEYVINKDRVFSDSKILVEDHKTYKFVANPHPVQVKQSSDEPYASRQIRAYEDCLDNFYNTINNQYSRLNWLWQSFGRAFFPKTMSSDFAQLTTESQRITVKDLSPIIWKGWTLWMEQMLHVPQKDSIAPEIIFHSLFEQKLTFNKKYQESLPKHLNLNFKSIKYESPTYEEAPAYLQANFSAILQNDSTLMEEDIEEDIPVIQEFDEPLEEMVGDPTQPATVEINSLEGPNTNSVINIDDIDTWYDGDGYPDDSPDSLAD